MQKKKGQEAKAVVQGSTKERISWLLQNLWDSNQSAMANAIGCSQSLLSRVRSGEQGPGRRLLERIAGHPRVNPGWLLSGQGEPLLPEADLDSLPMSRVLLPGPVSSHQELLLAKRYPVPRAFHRASRYCLLLSGSFPIVASKSAMLQVEDMLVLETEVVDLDLNLLQPQFYGVVRSADQNSPGCRLCEITIEGDPEEQPLEIWANAYTPKADRHYVTRRISDTFEDGRIRTRTTRLVESVDKDGRRKLRSPLAQDRPKSKRQIKPQDIISVGVLLLRDFDIRGAFEDSPVP